jgi:hypothetical protein
MTNPFPSNFSSAPSKVVKGSSESNYYETITEFARAGRITRCPTAYLSPTQGVISVADRAALEAHFTAREQVRSAKAIARARSGYHPMQLTSTAIAEEVQPEPPLCDDTRMTLHPRQRRADLRRSSANPDNETVWTFGPQSSESWISLINKARRLEGEATTATVKRYLRQLIHRYELLKEQDSAEATIRAAHGRPSGRDVRCQSARALHRNRV